MDKTDGQAYLGTTRVLLELKDDPRTWPRVWTSPGSLSPASAFNASGMAGEFISATWTSSPAGWIIETTERRAFWTGKAREGFRLYEEEVRP